MCWLNPGSCGPRRFHQPVTMAVVSREEQSFSVERVDILPEMKQEVIPDVKEKDMEKLMDGILKDMQKGLDMEKIGKKHHVPSRFAEQVCRIYMTHPGVTVQGIMDKMEVNARVMK